MKFEAQSHKLPNLGRSVFLSGHVSSPESTRPDVRQRTGNGGSQRWGNEPPCHPSPEEMRSACVVATPCSLCLVMSSWGTWVMTATTVSSFAAGRKAGLIQARVTGSSAHYHLACGCLLSFVFGWKAALFTISPENPAHSGLLSKYVYGVFNAKSVVPKFISSAIPLRIEVLSIPSSRCSWVFHILLMAPCFQESCHSSKYHIHLPWAL